MFDYDYNGEQKHTMIMGHLTHNHYKMNILYEDYEGSQLKCIISTNINDFYDEEEDILKIKKVFKNMLKEHFTKQYMSVKWKIPEYIQHLILNKI
jgi:hypothetical protein